MFFVGAPEASWLPRSGTPTMISRNRLESRRSPLEPARAPWFLDSAAYTELEAHGAWTLVPEEWAKLAARWSAEAGQLVAVATQDWLCTPGALARTSLTVAEHQRRTVGSFLELRQLAPELPWVPTLQGAEPADYLRHADQYDAAGVELEHEAIVGVGSVARRQHLPVATTIFGELRRRGLANLHAYGAKAAGLASFGWALSTADSMAWSTIARSRGIKATSCTASHEDCRNCLAWAEEWAAGIAPLVGTAGQDQPTLFV